MNKQTIWGSAKSQNENIINKTISEVSREKSAEILAEILMSDEISTYKMFEELAEKFLEGNEDCKKGINLACAVITGYDLFELSEKLLKES